MYKFTFPSTKSCILSSESSTILEDPNIPSCSEHNFKEEGMLELGSCMMNTLLNIRSPGPVNRQITPNSAAEVAIEKQVQPIFINIFIANDTKIVIQRISPMSAYQQVLGVESIKE